MAAFAAEDMDATSVPEAGPAAGERALMRAVLEDAIHCLTGGGSPARLRGRLAAEARAWISDPDETWPFSFVNLCEALGFCPDSLRTRLLRNHPPLPDDDFLAAPNPRRPSPSAEDVSQMIADGHPLRVVANRFGISVSRASVLSAGLASRMRGERDERIRDLRREGWTHQAIAARFGLSRIRVLRICARRDASSSTPCRSAA